MTHTALVCSLAGLPTEVTHWALDAPRHEHSVDLASGQLQVQGWLLHSMSPCLAQVLVRPSNAAQGELQRFAFNRGRPDVITRVLGVPSGGHPQLLCGFSIALPLSCVPFDLGFELGDQPAFWLRQIDMREALKVIEGPEGWLFLDNDSNNSVDQHTGALLLDAPAVRQWRGFFANCRGLASRFDLVHGMIVAPSKEEVLRHRYPHPRGGLTVLDQVRAAAQAQDHFVDAAAVLSSRPDVESLFKRTDTHWTDRGAMLSTLALLAAVGFDSDAAARYLADDRYRIERYVGDLGVKLLPLRSAPTEFLDAPPPESGAAFDNGLPNIGRVLVFDSPDAPFEKRLLVFGASSGYPMLKYLKRLFRRVVFVHSAGSVDALLVAQERPQVLLTQSNGRFLIRPPRADFNLAEAVAEKLQTASESALRRALESSAAASPNSDNQLYIDMLRPRRGAGGPVPTEVARK